MKKQNLIIAAMLSLSACATGYDPQEIEARIGHQVDVIIDAGPTGIEPTSVIDLSHGSIEILREGLGDVSAFR